MKLSKPFVGAVWDGSLCLLGTVGIIYFQQSWGGADFWEWFPVSVVATCLGVLVLTGSLFAGLVGGVLARFRRRGDHNANK